MDIDHSPSTTFCGLSTVNRLMQTSRPYRPEQTAGGRMCVHCLSAAGEMSLLVRNIARRGLKRLLVMMVGVLGGGGFSVGHVSSQFSIGRS